MAKITTLEGMRNYCKLMCGMPVINVEVDDTQINQIIEDSIQDFHRYNYDEGTFLDYALFTISAGVQDYPLSASPLSATEGRIQDIYDLSMSFGTEGINTLFSPAHVLLYDQYVNMGNYPGGPGGYGASNTGLQLAGYQISMMYLDEIKAMFGKMYHANWLPGREVIRIVPTPSDTATGVIALYRREYEEHLYNHPLVKKLCVGRTMQQMAWHLNKYGATLPDGININAADMMTKGETKEQEAMENIRLESQPIDFFIA